MDIEKISKVKTDFYKRYKKKVRIAIIIDKLDLRAKKVIRVLQEHYIVIIGSVSKKDNNPKCSYTKDSYKICETKTDRTQRSKEKLNYSWRL